MKLLTSMNCGRRHQPFLSNTPLVNVFILRIPSYKRKETDSVSMQKRSQSLGKRVFLKQYTEYDLLFLYCHTFHQIYCRVKT